MSEALRLLAVGLVAGVVLGLDMVGRTPTYSTRWVRNGTVWSVWHGC